MKRLKAILITIVTISTIFFLPVFNTSFANFFELSISQMIGAYIMEGMMSVALLAASIYLWFETFNK